MRLRLFRPRHRLEDVERLINIEAGRFDPSKLTLFSIFRDEAYFLEAFLSHYRALGIEQFLIFDDGSKDGTEAHLAAQTDVVLLRGKYRFGEMLYVDFPDGKRRKLRAGTYFKAAITHHFLQDCYALYADADEFLLLPPNLGSLHDVITTLKQRGSQAIMASIIEFFPKNIQTMLQSAGPPQNFGTLIERFGFFEPHPVIAIIPGRNEPSFIGAAKSEMLFQRYEITQPAPSTSWVPWKNSKKPTFSKTARHKTPIIQFGTDRYLIGSHHANIAPDPELMLCMAHFVFTDQFYQKAQRAITWKGHAEGASKYQLYMALYEKMRAHGGDFMGPNTLRYQDEKQVLDIGLISWPDQK